MGPSELAVIGLTCCLVGVFFLANSIIFRRPRKVIEEFFGVGVGSLTVIRDYALNKMQVVIGFLFLNAGFLLEAFAFLDGLERQLLTTVICIAIVGFAGLVYLVGLIWSRRSFRRYLSEFFGKHNWSFTENMQMTKEIGLLLGIPHTPDMTVEDYVRKVKQALGVPLEQVTSTPDRTRRLRDISAIPGR
jgi:hypothetical protein